MKKLFNYALAAALMGGVSLGVTSCKSDENTAVDEIQMSTVTLDNDILTHGVVTDMENTVIELPVKCDGDWAAVLSIDDKAIENKNSWVKIQDWRVVYNGNQTLRLQIDDNMTGYDRSTTLTLINNAGETVEVPVRQNYNWKGQAPTNSSAQSFQNKGLGYGIDYNYLLNLKSIRYRSSGEDASASIKNSTNESGSVDFNPLKCKKLANIYHLSTIDQLCQDSLIDKDAYVEEPIEIDNMDAVMLDGAVRAADSLSIALRLEGSIGPVSFGIEGRYVDGRKENRNYVDYTIIRNAPVYDVMTSPASLTTYAKNHATTDNKSLDAYIQYIEGMRANFIRINKGKSSKTKVGEDGLTDKQRRQLDGLYDKIITSTSYGGVFSSHFESCMSELFYYITMQLAGGDPIDEVNADLVCANLDDHYGPFIIAGGQYGGSLVVQLKLDTLRLDGEMSVDGKAKVELALFEGEGDARYRQEGMNRTRSYYPKINVYGGDADEVMSNLLGILWGDHPDSHEQWDTTLSDWLDSMKSNGDDLSTAAPISFTAVPIWTFFPDKEIAAYVRSYFMNKYKTRGIKEYLDIIDNVPDHKNFIEMMNGARENEPLSKEPVFDNEQKNEN